MKHISDLTKNDIERLTALHRKSMEAASAHEANVAGSFFLAQLDRLGITYDEWLGNKNVEIHIRIKLAHKKLFLHSLWVIFGNQYHKFYSYAYSVRGNRVKTEFFIHGPMQLVAEFRQYFYFHCDNYDQEVEIFQVAYIHAQDMYGEAFPDTGKPDKPMTDAEMEKAHRAGQLSLAIGKNFKKYIE
jgi:hypothetical protein